MDNLVYRDVYGSTGIINHDSGKFEAYESQDEADALSRTVSPEEADLTSTTSQKRNVVSGKVSEKLPTADAERKAEDTRAKGS